MNRRFFLILWLVPLFLAAPSRVVRAAQDAPPAVSSVQDGQAGDVTGSPEQPPDPRARPLLEEILRRPEFSSVHKTSSLEKAQIWLAHKLAELLAGLFGKIAGYPMAGSILFWLLIFGAAVWLAFLLFRYWNRRAGAEELQPLDQAILGRTWQEWIGRAREAAGRGDFREAIHCVYWASVAHLAGRGFLPSGRTYTPREYLRLLSHAGDTLLPPPDFPAKRQSLALITTRLETVWYGRGKADAGDFQAALQQAEELGCRLE